jgi:hypothetical protein
MTDKTVEQVILSLRVIGSIREKDRLYTSSGNVVVSPSFKSDFLYRGIPKLYCLESREKNLQDVKNILDTAFTLIDGLIATEEVFQNTIHNEAPSRRRVMEITKNQQTLGRLSECLDSAITGLRNWQSTYESDVTTKEGIKLFIDNIEDKLLQIRKSKEYFETHPSTEMATRGGEKELCTHCQRMLQSDSD